MALPTFPAECCAAARAIDGGRPPLSIDISCPHGTQQQTHHTPMLLSINGTDRRMDTRALQWPCSACYTDCKVSVNLTRWLRPYETDYIYTSVHYSQMVSRKKFFWPFTHEPAESVYNIVHEKHVLDCRSGVTKEAERGQLPLGAAGKGAQNSLARNILWVMKTKV